MLTLSKKPDFFIVGAAKAGTTALWAALRTHPQMFMIGNTILDKEPCFFVDGYGIDTMDKYSSLFSACTQEKMIGDASAAHLSAPESAKRIFDFNSDAKILICLRSPVDRAYSLYNWMVQEGYEWIYPFERAILKEPLRKQRAIPNFYERAFRDDYMYFSSGLYYEQVKRYLSLFGNNVKVVIFEEMIKSPQIILEECMDFLGVDRRPIELGRENPSIAVHSPKLQWFLRLIDSEKMRMNRKWPRDFFIEWGRRKVRPKKLSEATRLQLSAQYEGDIQSLEALINKDLAIWRGDS